MGPRPVETRKPDPNALWKGAGLYLAAAVAVNYLRMVGFSSIIDEFGYCIAAGWGLRKLLAVWMALEYDTDKTADFFRYWHGVALSACALFILSHVGYMALTGNWGDVGPVLGPAGGTLIVLLVASPYARVTNPHGV